MFTSTIQITPDIIGRALLSGIVFGVLAGLLPLVLGLALGVGRQGVRGFVLCVVPGVLSPLLALYIALTASAMILARKRPDVQRQILGFAVILAVTLLIAFIGTLAFIGPTRFADLLLGGGRSLQMPSWYDLLRKPDWTPPGEVFGPVWSVLYVLMAVAAWLVWRVRGFAGAQVALGLYALQLALNGLWSVLFFHLHALTAATVEIVVLWAAILATTLAFRRISATAAVLMLPYLAWVTFASALTFAIWRLNG
jgi:tryptophan-rich sensory protein